MKGILINKVVHVNKEIAQERERRERSEIDSQ